MKPGITTPATLGLSLLLGSVAWSAPKASAAIKVPTKAPVAAVDEISVATDDGGHGGGLGGGSEEWRLRADGTASHFKTGTASDQAQGLSDISDAIGLTRPNAYNQMLEFLQWTRLLDLKAPKVRDDGEHRGIRVSLRRGGKTKDVFIADDYAFAGAAIGTTLMMAQSLTRDVHWKTAAQFKASSGLAVFYQIDPDLSPAEIEAAKTFPRPIFAVLNSAGKPVASLRPQTEAERAPFLSPAPSFRGDSFIDPKKDVDAFLRLAPGSYRLGAMKLDGVTPAAMKEYVWSEINLESEDSKVTHKVVPGQFNYVFVRLIKKPTA